MFGKLRHRFFSWIANSLREHNGIYTTKGSKIGKDVRLKNVMLFGTVILGDNCKIMDGVTINGNSKVVIGRFTSISGPNTDIVANINPVNIGAFTSIARNVTIQESNHRFDRPSTFNVNYNIIDGDWTKDSASKGSIDIGNDVWIGTHSVILTGVKIGSGAVVAANSVVTSDIPPYAIVGGSPAKVISYRFPDDIIGALQELQWWEWSAEKIKANKEFFEGTPTLQSIRKIS